MIGKGVKAAAKTKTGRRGARKAAKIGAKGAVKAGKGAGKVALKGAKAQAKLARQAAATREPTSKRFLKYGLFAAAGFAVGALVARSSSRDGAGSSSTGGTGQHDPGGPAGRRGEAWGSGTPLGTAGGPPPPPPPGGPPPPPAGGPRPHRPEEPRRTGADRDYSGPSEGPLIGEQHPRGSIADVPEQQEEVEQRIRARIGEDPRTASLPRLNIEVNDGIADIRGAVPSEEVKKAVEEIVAGTEGVRQVRNLIAVSN